MNAKIIDKKVKFEQPLVFSGDKNANSIIFEMPCIYNGIDLDQVPAYVKTCNALGNSGKSVLEVTRSGDTLIIEWVLGLEATVVSGELECQIVFESMDGEVIMNTMPFSVIIQNSVTDSGSSVNIQTNHVTQLQNKLQEQIERVDEILAEGILTDANLEEKVANLSDQFGSRCFLFDSLEGAISTLNYLPGEDFKVGDCIRIKEYGVPHFYVTAVHTDSVIQEQTTVEGLIELVKQNGYFRAGWCDFAFISSHEEQIPPASECNEGEVLTVQNGKWVAKSVSLKSTYQGDLEVIS